MSVIWKSRCAKHSSCSNPKLLQQNGCLSLIKTSNELPWRAYNAQITNQCVCPQTCHYSEKNSNLFSCWVPKKLRLYKSTQFSRRAYVTLLEFSDVLAIIETHQAVQTGNLNWLQQNHVTLLETRNWYMKVNGSQLLVKCIGTSNI